MKAFLITYDGVWLGGKAVVLAETKEEAIELVKNDEQTVEFNDVQVEQELDIKFPCVFYNDNGDY
jgi:hypothetical protein